MDANNQIGNQSPHLRGAAWRRSLAWKSRALFLLVLAIGIVSSTFAVVQLRKALNAMEKSDAAHTVLEQQLDLASLGHRLSHHDLHDPGSMSPEARRLRGEIDLTALELRKSIAREIALRGSEGMAEEGQEIAGVDAIMAHLNASLAGRDNDRWVELIDEAVAEEKREVAEIDREEAQALYATISMLLIAAGTIFALYTTGLFWLDRSITVPLAHLRRATEQVASGEKGVRIGQLTHVEFDELADNFNHMAEALDSRRNDLENSAAWLEELVAQRTTDLTVANSTLTRHAETRQRFLTDISHELRTPIALIRGDAEVTLRGGEKPPEEYKSALARIVGQAVGLTRLVDDLLYVARNQSGDSTVKLRPLDLLAIVKRVADTMRRALEEDGGQIVIITRLESARIMGEEQRLHQLMHILLDNAVHYSDLAPEIEIEILRATGGYALLVRDHGIGIPEEEMSEVFDRFHRGQNRERTYESELGIGLPMAKSIVEAHGGTIRIESTTDVGTTVTVTLAAVERLKVAHEHIGG